MGAWSSACSGHGIPVVTECAKGGGGARRYSYWWDEDNHVGTPPANQIWPEIFVFRWHNTQSQARISDGVLQYSWQHHKKVRVHTTDW